MLVIYILQDQCNKGPMKMKGECKTGVITLNATPNGTNLRPSRSLSIATIRRVGRRFGVILFWYAHHRTRTSREWLRTMRVDAPFPRCCLNSLHLLGNCTKAHHINNLKKVKSFIVFLYRLVVPRISRLNYYL